MADYFGEHGGWEELGEGEAPNHFLHFARLLVESGWGAELQFQFEQMFPRLGQPSPAASKAAVEALPPFPSPERPAGQPAPQCPVCLAPLEAAGLQMPCAHRFHKVCLLPWLAVTNSCPLCREEMPTDDDDYEAYKKAMADKAARDQRKDEIHDAMYS